MRLLAGIYLSNANYCHGVIFVTLVSTITNIPANPQTPNQNHFR